MHTDLGDNKEDITCKRFRQLRQELNLTQSEFGKKLNIATTTSDIERGRSKITGKLCMQLLKDYNINPLWLYGESQKKYLNPHFTEVIPKAITLDFKGNENMILVNEKASAGYGMNLDDKEYLEKLPIFSIPLPEYRNNTFRGFQIVGDSMYPMVSPGDWVLAKALSSFDELKDDNIYIIVEKESIRLKKIRILEKGKKLELISINIEYPPVQLSSDRIVEIWEYHSALSFKKDQNNYISEMEKITNEINQIKKRIDKMG